MQHDPGHGLTTMARIAYIPDQVRRVMFYAALVDEETGATFTELADVPSESIERVGVTIVNDAYGEDDGRSTTFYTSPEEMTDDGDSVEYRWKLAGWAVDALNRMPYYLS